MLAVGFSTNLNDRFLVSNHCHCSTCRKIHGAAFGTFGHAEAKGFCWTQGEQLLTGCGYNFIAEFDSWRQNSQQMLGNGKRR
ncbi:MAG: hypothetical protein HC772_19095 [Leptolyngbyaceae cyanobacterium CRU_2_3]|nr:hypothetical protein [Acaryochloridaceae cyanobacterium CSU_3_4]NJR66934.1 hypothetical protein [Leptolyngbyaceae cyanobacterium CRU_2_3]